MSTRITTKANKKASQTIIPSSSLVPQRRLVLPQQVDEVPTSRDRPLHDTLAEPSLGHDFGQIQVHSDAEAVQPVVESCPLGFTSPRFCPFGGACHTCPPRVQAKLTINQPDDRYEREADLVAEQVMRMPEPQAARATRASAPSQAPSTHLPRQTTHQATPSLVPPIVYDVLRSPGQPLGPATRALMESRFGHDFSRVRVHTDTKAAQSARLVNASAYTVGHDVAFATGQYEPRTSKGQELIAHELTHTLQQGHSRPHGSRLVMGETSDSREAEADRVAGQVALSVAPTTTPQSIRAQTSFPTSVVQRSPGDTAEQVEAMWDPLAYARSLSTRYPGWLNILPDCPCSDSDASANPDVWVGGVGGCPSATHPGAVTGYRSRRGYASIPDTGHGQQCCYDANGRLMTSGAAAGTPDLWSPSVDFVKHQVFDVQTWVRLGWGTYNQYWIPNDGGGLC